MLCSVSGKHKYFWVVYEFLTMNLPWILKRAKTLVHTTTIVTLIFYVLVCKCYNLYLRFLVYVNKTQSTKNLNNLLHLSLNS